MLPIKRIPSAFFISLALGAASVALVFYGYTRAVGSELFVQLVFSEEGGGRLALKFTNVGRRDLVLNTANMSYTLVPSLDNVPYYLVYIHAGVYSLRSQSETMLAAGKSLEIGNILPLVRTLPPGETFLSVLYQSEPRVSAGTRYWHGTIRSFPIQVELTGE